MALSSTECRPGYPGKRAPSRSSRAWQVICAAGPHPSSSHVTGVALDIFTSSLDGERKAWLTMRKPIHTHPFQHAEQRYDGGKSGSTIRQSSSCKSFLKLSLGRSLNPLFFGRLQEGICVASVLTGIAMPGTATTRVCLKTAQRSG